MGLREIFFCIAVVVAFGIDTWLLARDFRNECKRLEKIKKHNDEIIKKYKGEQPNGINRRTKKKSNH